MHDSASDSDDCPVRESAHAADAPSDQPTDLDSVVVRYDDRPNRRTIFPRGCPDEQKLTTWMTAESSAFVDLDDWR